MKPEADAIAAISTPAGAGGIGIIRISGTENDIQKIISSLLGRKSMSPRVATYLPFLDKNKNAIDAGIAIFFPAPHSYTGEDVLELQGHGGMVVLQLVLQQCLCLGARLAEPGEFTQRAFFNNKLDLTQAEAVADLINATTIQAAHSARRSMQGALSKIVTNLISDLIQTRVWVEAHLDFPEEEIADLELNSTKKNLLGILQGLENAQQQSRQGALLNEGASVVLLGRPNVGKSSLLNQLAGNEVAIVSEIPGTTRDIIHQSLQIEGVPLHIIDTAGLRVTDDQIEQMGVKRAQKAAQQANVILWLSDVQVPDFEDSEIQKSIPENVPVLYVLNKADLVNSTQSSLPAGKKIITISAKTGKGMDSLRAELLKQVGWRGEEGVFIARERHLRHLAEAKNHIEEALYHSVQNLEILAEELRLAQNELNKITGEFSNNDLLDEIFGQFCIGK